MIPHQELRKKATELKLRVDWIEKDYVLGWMLYGVANSSVSDKLVFKGCTALSKIYFPNQWRLSEDLDFTSVDGTEWEKFIEPLGKEMPEIVKKVSRITIKPRIPSHTNHGYLQSSSIQDP